MIQIAHRTPRSFGAGQFRRWMLACLVLTVSVVTSTGPALATFPRMAGTFTLTSHTGQTIDSADLIGEPYAIFFGFTNCPVVCPTTLGELSIALADLAQDRSRLKAFFVTLDPERDTPEMLANYLKSFDSGITALTGTPDEIASVARDFGVVANRLREGNSYTIEHTAAVLIVDRNGLIVDGTAEGDSPAETIRKLRRVIEPE